MEFADDYDTNDYDQDGIDRTQELSLGLLQYLKEEQESDDAECMNALAYSLVCVAMATIVKEPDDIALIRKGEARKEIQLLIGEMFDNIMDSDTDV